MTELNHVGNLVVSDVFAKDHIFVEIACIENTGRKPNLLNVCINMVFAWIRGQLKGIKDESAMVPSYIFETKRPPEIWAELGSELQIKHCTPASNDALTKFLP